MHPLLDERTPDQAALLDTIYEGRERLGKPDYLHAAGDGSQRPMWPTFQYVERTLSTTRGLDAKEILSTCPVIHAGGGAYGWTWDESGGAVLSDHHRIGLTVAGMSHLSAAEDEVRLFLDALGVMVHNERIFIPLPEAAELVTMTHDALREIMGARETPWRLRGRGYDALCDILRHEPSTWHCHIEESQLVLHHFLRRYNNVDTGEAYVQRVLNVNPVSIIEPEPLHPSSLALPEALDYLNLAWRLHAGAPLLAGSRVDAAAKLGLDCATVDEFESRISALGTFLAVKVPGSTKHTLAELRAYLEQRLGADESARAAEAIDDLRAVLDLRVWRQHSADERGAKGLARLGLALPIYDWGAAWEHVQARAVIALSALREEVELLPAA